MGSRQSSIPIPVPQLPVPGPQHTFVLVVVCSWGHAEAQNLSPFPNLRCGGTSGPPPPLALPPAAHPPSREP